MSVNLWNMSVKSWTIISMETKSNALERLENRVPPQIAIELGVSKTMLFPISMTVLVAAN